jgi:UPF0755 protein
VAHEHRDALEAGESHTLLFGFDEHDDYPPPSSAAHPPHPSPGYPPRGSRHPTRRRRARVRRLVLAVALLAVLIVAVSGWLVVRPLVTGHQAPDWPGPGTGQVRVHVNPGDGTQAIGAALAKAGVVRSAGAFTTAAAGNSDAQNLQPGLYQLRAHMSAAQALAVMLDPASRLVVKVTIPEGTTERVILAKLAAALKSSAAAAEKTAADIGNLALPEGYTRNGAAPTSAEGFLYPATYSFDPGTGPADALQQMTAEFIAQDRQLDFAGTAKQRQVSPYQALIIASMIEGEAKYDADRAKVARVIYNRLASGIALKVDATSRYGAAVLGKDPAAVAYSQLDSPYNTYLHKGLPPTPINNPGAAAMTAAVHPASGNWLFYVNGDAQGHLSFFDKESDWAKAVAVCRRNGWGCD